MKKYLESNRFLRDVVSIAAITVGFFALLTPFTPGSWLIPMGMVGLFGKERARHMSVRILGKKLYSKSGLTIFFE